MESDRMFWKKGFNMNFKGFILTLGCFVASLSAATSYNIHGTVISAKDNKPLQGAIVTLQQINVADTTESDGNFLLENLDSSAIDSSEKKRTGSTRNQKLPRSQISGF